MSIEQKYINIAKLSFMAKMCLIKRACKFYMFVKNYLYKHKWTKATNYAQVLTALQNTKCTVTVHNFESELMNQACIKNVKTTDTIQTDIMGNDILQLSLIGEKKAL